MFPEETASSLVELTPAKPLSLDAFTLCLRFATELKGKREVILFAYRTQTIDELNVWRTTDGRYELRDSKCCLKSYGPHEIIPE